MGHGAKYLLDVATGESRGGWSGLNADWDGGQGGMAGGLEAAGVVCLAPMRPSLRLPGGCRIDSALRVR